MGQLYIAKKTVYLFLISTALNIEISSINKIFPYEIHNFKSMLHSYQIKFCQILQRIMSPK